MQQTFAALLTAYLAAILIFQTNWLHPIQDDRFWKSIFRGGTITLSSCLFLGTLNLKLLSVILAIHFVVETIQTFLLSDSLASLLANQCSRLSACLVLAVYFPVANDGWWVTKFRPELSHLYFAVLSCASGIILCVPAGGVLIAKLIGSMAEEIRDFEIAGLSRGGQYIGWLERSLVMLLVLADQPNGIGFLIAAKSILRFGEIKDASQRKVTEYIIIGTFLSFGWALMISLLVQKTLRYWMQ